MAKNKDELIKYRMERADKSLDEAKLLAAESYWNSTINRLYYACYYIISALLAQHDLNAKTHSGLKTLFYQHFIKDEVIGKEFGEFYSKLFDKRQKGDYEDFQLFEEDEVLPLIPKTDGFLTVVKNLIQS
jgi:uncharacterized protein (UPF0332 family)